LPDRFDRVRNLMIIALGAVTIYAALCAGLFLAQWRLVYLPSRQVLATPAARGLAFEDVWLEAEGERVHGWYLPGALGSKTVLFFHGNAGNIGDRLDSLAIFAELGLSVFIIDYRGYGLSDGAPGEAATYADARAAWEHLVHAREVAPEDIVIFGRSLGGGVAAWLAERVEAGGLILESSFTSVPDLAARMYPLFPVRWLARIRYDTRARLPRVGCPVLVAHSPDDELVPYAHGQGLFEAADEPKEFLEILGPHGDGFLRTGRGYVEGLRGFIESL
jgi:fermentation-respiration switch protein FrsA (DUF1100 family)